MKLAHNFLTYLLNHPKKFTNKITLQNENENNKKRGGGGGNWTD